MKIFQYFFHKNLILKIGKKHNKIFSELILLNRLIIYSAEAELFEFKERTDFCETRKHVDRQHKERHQGQEQEKRRKNGRQI